MIERQDKRPPVSYTTFQARDLGGDTAQLVKTCAQQAFDRFTPDVLLVGESCTAELLQDQAGIWPPRSACRCRWYRWSCRPTRRRKTGAPARRCTAGAQPAAGSGAGARHAARRTCAEPGPRANILGPTSLGFRCRDDVVEITRLLAQLGIEINATVPLGASADDIRRLPDADFNIDLYPETSRATALWLEKSFGQPRTTVVPIGLSATREFIAQVATLAGVDAAPILGHEQPGVASLSASQARMQWYARSVDSTYLTGKRVFIFGDATHAIAAARIAREDMGFTVVGLGTFSREFARDVRDAAKAHGVEALISDDYLEVEAAINAAAPELVLGTQMERHIAKRLGIACAVISTPIHVQDVPARYSPVLGFEGANVLFDSWVHPLVMGLEEHLLQMFRDDFEFHDGAAASHLPRTARPAPAAGQPAANAPAIDVADGEHPPSPLPRRSRAGRPKANRSCARSRSSCATRRAGTPNASPPNAASRRSRWKHSMKPRPTSAAERIPAPPMRVVIVTLDSHLASATERAQHVLLREIPGPAPVAACRRRMGRRQRRAGALPRRHRRRRHHHRHDDVHGGPLPGRCCPPCGRAATTATRWSAACRPPRWSSSRGIGRFDMSNGGGGPLALLKKLRGNTGSDSKRQGSSGAQQLKMLRRIPKLLRFIPGTAQDVRAYFLTLSYWLAGSDDNVANLVRYLVDRYAAGERAVMRGKLKYAAPAEYPEVGIYHPRLKQRISEEAARCHASATPAARSA
jgi:light-independent protochlorophyllide reductase B subunit